MRAHANALRKATKRLPMNLAIRNLSRWQPLEDPQDGYALIIGCMRELWHVALANARLVHASHTPSMRELVLVFDCTDDRIPTPVADWVATATTETEANITLVPYSPRQAHIATKINWGWVYAWLSWTKGIAHASTRHAILHDLDAMPIEHNLIESIYTAARDARTVFTGIKTYEGSGVTKDMALAATPEMTIDIQQLRNESVPFDAFNKVRIVDGRFVDFDTFLHIQHRLRSSSIRPINEDQLVHPSQLICQHTDFIAGRDRLTTKNHNLLLLKYLAYLGGDTEQLAEAADRLSDPASTSVAYRDRTLEVGHIQPAHWAWSEKQIRRIEQALFGHTRPDVEHFLQGIIERAGEARTVGREPLHLGGVRAE